MGSVFGSREWLDLRGGRLSRRERWRMVAQGAVVQAAALLSGRRARRARHVDLDELTPPDSDICRAAEAVEQAACPPWLVNHNRRAFIWGRLLEEEPEADLEAFFISAALHDIGLTERYRGQGPDRECFTLAGAREAEGLAAEAGWDGKRTRIAADAIALHLNIALDHRHGPEARMLRAGTAADVVGQAQTLIAPQMRQEVVARHPRLGFKQRIIETFEEDRRLSPCCRAAFLFHTLRATRMVKKTPFFEE